MSPKSSFLPVALSSCGIWVSIRRSQNRCKANGLLMAPKSSLTWLFSRDLSSLSVGPQKGEATSRKQARREVRQLNRKRHGFCSGHVQPCRNAQDDRNACIILYSLQASSCGDLSKRRRLSGCAVQVSNIFAAFGFQQRSAISRLICQALLCWYVNRY